MRVPLLGDQVRRRPQPGDVDATRDDGIDHALIGPGRHHLYRHTQLVAQVGNQRLVFADQLLDAFLGNQGYTQTFRITFGMQRRREQQHEQSDDNLPDQIHSAETSRPDANSGTSSAATGRLKWSPCAISQPARFSFTSWPRVSTPPATPSDPMRWARMMVDERSGLSSWLLLKGAIRLRSSFSLVIGSACRWAKPA